jgi:hypothetical protein
MYWSVSSPGSSKITAIERPGGHKIIYIYTWATHRDRRRSRRPRRRPSRWCSTAAGAARAAARRTGPGRRAAAPAARQTRKNGGSGRRDRRLRFPGAAANKARTRRENRRGRDGMGIIKVEILQIKKKSRREHRGRPAKISDQQHFNQAHFSWRGQTDECRAS